MAMKPSKELTMIGQGLLIGVVYALGVITFWAACTVLLFFSIRQVNAPPFLGGFSAAGIAMLITVLSLKLISTLKQN